MATEVETVVEAHALSKQYRLFDKPIDRLKEALSPFGTKYHTDFYAVRDVSCSIKRGESLAIIGRNGSGKSTFLKLVTGVITPTDGTISVHGRVAALLELGAGFNPEYSGVENVYLNGTIQGYTRAQLDLKMPEILAFADIGDFAKRPCKSYSSGMFARLAFAAMIHFEPDVLIVDEALAVGDVFFQQKCFRWMKERMANVTKLLVSHDMGSVAQLATRAIVLEKGRVAFEGEPIKAIEHYTKTLHTELFARPEAIKVEPAPSEQVSETFTPIDPASLGGAREADIVGWHVEVGDAPVATGPATEVQVVRAGDVVHVALEFKTSRAVEHLIIGVTITDRFGQAVFGVNSLGSGYKLGVEQSGTKSASLEFVWPEIKQGRYFLTFGLGEGEEELEHVVQCWAHNVTSLEVLPVRPVHGIFNVKMDRISIRDA
ncbi:ABC transporter ATP-binding protein [soil metagenome]